MNEMAGGSGRVAVVDHSLHGLITTRLIGAPPSAVRELEHLLGPSDGQPVGEPDITITFVEDLGAQDRLHYIGLSESAYDQDGFYLLDQRSRRAQFDFERLGDRWESLTESGESFLPYLLPVVSLRLLQKGYVMLHASSLVFEGKGVLVAGWQKGGKTEMLLSFMNAGAHYLADEWTIISPHDGLMWGIPGTLKIWEWHLRYMPDYWRQLRPAERHRLRVHRLYQQIYRRLPSELRRSGFVGERLYRLSLDGGVPLLGLFQSQPGRLFGSRVWHGSAPIDLVFLAGVGTEIAVSPVEPAEVALRMGASLEYERRSLIARYQQFRYAFPNRRNAFLEAASDREREYLEQALRGRRAYTICHPYPVALGDLYEACAPLVVGVDTASREAAISRKTGEPS